MVLSMKKEKSRLKKVKSILIGVCVIVYVVLFYYLYIHFYSKRPIKLDVCEYTNEQKQDVIDLLLTEKTSTKFIEKTNKYWRNLLEDELNFHIYFHYYDELTDSTVGLSNKYFRTIIMDISRTNTGYIRTFTHEVMHIKLCSSNEKYVCYETFKFLYENENTMLKRTAIVYAIDQLTGAWDNSPNYDIKSQIMYYFLKEQGELNVQSIYN